MRSSHSSTAIPVASAFVTREWIVRLMFPRGVEVIVNKSVGGSMYDVRLQFAGEHQKKELAELLRSAAEEIEKDAT
jgi:hypothetical protein